MSYKPGDTYEFVFITCDATGKAVNADSTPSGVFRRNGSSDTNATLSITALGSGVYTVSGTIASTANGAASGDRCNIYITATINSIATAGNVASFVLDAKRVGDLHDISVTNIWQDATGSDFTVAGSIGQSLYTGVAPGAANGLFIAGTNAATVITTSLTAHIIGTVDTVTTLSNLPAIPANWLTAAGIAAGALNGTGDWLLAASYTVPPTASAIATATAAAILITPANKLATDGSGYMTFNNSGIATSGNQTTILNAINAIYNGSARSVPHVPSTCLIPASGYEDYTVDLYLYNGQGQLEDPDSSTVTAHARDAAGYSLDANLTGATGVTTMVRQSVGWYRITYRVLSTNDQLDVYFDFSWSVSSEAMKDGGSTTVANADNLTTLGNIYNIVSDGTHGNAAILARGNTAWTTAVGFAAPSDVTNAVSDIESHGDSRWLTAVGFATSNPNNAVIGNIYSALTDASTGLIAIKTQTGVIASILAGITSLANWLRGFIRSDTMDSTAKAEVNNGGGAYNEATDSNEALAGRNNPLTPQQTADSLGLTPTSGTPASGSVYSTLGVLTAPSTGNGAWAATVTVTDGTTPIQGATVRFTKGAETWSGTTDVNGLLAFSLDNGSYGVTITGRGYSYTPTTRVINGANVPFAEVMTVINITPSDAPLTTAYTTIVDGQGTALPNTTVTLQMTTLPRTAGVGYQPIDITAISDSNGLVQVPLLRRAGYKIRGATGSWTPFTTKSDNTFAIPAW